MINSEKFIARLQKVIEFYDETASSFAEKIGVQRSSISHILSGRNKPSLDFVLKILSAYPDVELYWLLNGKGKFPSATIAQNDETAIDPIKPNLDASTPNEKTVATHSNKDGEKSIERIIIFYSDGTFKNFKPS
ncbi:MAG: helix-turn-helix domain-containing protein [Bacteroidota bacterium]